MRRQKAEVGQRAYIEWIDSSARFGWTKETEVAVAYIVSVGIITATDKTGVCITTSIDLGTATSNGNLSIPWSCITTFKTYEQVLKKTQED